ncbi:general odorant-binding protein 68-like [Anopheles nili]|uniref:general odorant-binding protein 68-like n=1 Tax=Anopheles nili TaxID=185578 RepID=UPI00237A0F4B|nr:general odorant-binding protein 68-like [Anopheles nili]
MATCDSRVSAFSWGKALLLLLWMVQLAQAEPNAACKNFPSKEKYDGDDQCCIMPRVFTNETVEQCASGMEQSDKPQLQKSCEFASCVMKKHKLLKSDGRFDLDQLRSLIKDSLEASSEWKSLMERVVLDECLPMVQKDSPNVMKELKSSLGDCDPVPAMLVACSAAKLFTKCPSKDWSGSAQCNEWKTYFSKCSSSVEDLNEMFNQIESQKLTNRR